MVYNFKVFKKCAPNGKITLYMAKRDFIDHISTVEPIDGVVLLDDEYVRGRKVFGQLVCTFRYGREEDEVMGLNFYKELFLASEQIYPPPEKRNYDLSRVQVPNTARASIICSHITFRERLIKKLGDTAVPFRLSVPAGAPGSVTLQPGLEDDGEPCGVQYYVKIFVGDSEIDRSHRRSTVALGIRKVQYAPAKPGPQPCTVVRKDFVLSPGQLELELTLDKQLYIHGETVAVNMCVRNHSNKVVKKIKACIQQGVDVVLFQNGQYRNVVASIETQDGCPLQPGSSLQKVLHLTPSLSTNRDKRGIALDGQLKRSDTTLASTTLLLDPDQRDAFGIVVSYSAKVKLYLGAISGELVAELPFILMHPKEGRAKMIHADSQADVEMFRQDTVHHQESVEVY
ncbi:arrestin homolog isoform X1 [Trichoplusia ni]|uniref:Arrestin homolog isoform X1 n=2 Tax=Trichoplusia ni TaxID=7111 RepID=A0A7E5VE74_TRINI|nr:arrestin homolog isoform X1 [Trichoplusia ni]